MAIPDLDMYGLLPVGTHQCTLHEIEQRFCWNAHRQERFDGLVRFIQDRWAPLKINADFLLDGSFTRNKDHPDDIDLVADLSHLPVPEAYPAVLLNLTNDVNKRLYHVDFWFKHPDLNPNDLVDFFQYTGLKAAAELNLEVKRRKGILKVTP